MMSGLMGTVVQGMAWGTGTSVARHAVDSMIGGGKEEAPAAPAAAPAPAYQAPSSYAPQSGGCNDQVKAFSDCMSNNNGDMGACNYFFESMQQCKVSMNMH